MNRAALVTGVRRLLRLIGTKPFSDDDIVGRLEFAIDDICNRVPFSVAVDRTHSIKDCREYILPADVLEVLEVNYLDAAGTTLSSAVTPSYPGVGQPLSVVSTTDFPDSGTVRVDSELIGYSSKTATTFVVSKRSNPASHAAGAGVVEYDTSIKWTRLAPTTIRRLGDNDPNYLDADADTPDSYYLFSNVIGFDKPCPKTGYMNIAVRSFIRPPSLSSDDSTVVGLLASFEKAVVLHAASALAQTLAQDEASLQQAAVWWQQFVNDIGELKKRQHMYERGLKSGLHPVVARPTGFKE